jgi:DNA-binding CsgD family transcriptional regulator
MILSSHQKEVYDLVMDGRSNAYIADKLCVEVKTVKYHITNILKLHGLKSRTQLVVYDRRKADKLNKQAVTEAWNRMMIKMKMLPDAQFSINMLENLIIELKLTEGEK